MADRYVVVDDTTGKYKRGGAVGGGGSASYSDEDFDVGGGGQTNFTTSGTVGALTKIDVYINGVLKREGSTQDWQRNTGLNRIEFNFTVLANAWVRIRFW
jgi:hypothetical protein